MPAFFTHYTFVKNNTSPIDKYAKIRALGGQGTDVFFFYGHTLRKRENKANIRYFGTTIHHINIADAYSFLLEYASKQADREMLFAYLKGLFMHYVMDRNCHPYIFYRTGFADPNSKNEKDADKYMNYHVGFEAILDTVYGKLNKTFQRHSKCAKCPDVQVKSVSKMYSELAKYIGYKGIDELTYFNAYKDMLFAESVLYSPLGVKKFFVHNVFMKNSNIDNMMSPARVKPFEQYDVLNLKHNDWLDCVSGEVHRESFLELVDNAKKELATVDAIIKKAKKCENIKSDMTKFVKNIDHDGFEVNAVKVHYQVYLDLEDKK